MNVRDFLQRFLAASPLSRASKLPKESEPIFTNSQNYWESRYAGGGNSGAGSYNRLAQFKAEFLNKFVSDNEIKSIIEFGCGDGSQLALAQYPSYIGVDVSNTILDAIRNQYINDQQYCFMHTSEVKSETKADLSLSLDVIFHLVEDEVFEAYMSQLFDAAKKFVIIYSSNKNKTWTVPHVRHRRFKTWIDANRPDFLFVGRTPNRYPYDPNDANNTSFADFYVFRSRN